MSDINQYQIFFPYVHTYVVCMLITIACTCGIKIISRISMIMKKKNLFQTYLKEILKEICHYNMKAPHRYMWELKPEYRHYKSQDATGSDTA